MSDTDEPSAISAKSALRFKSQLQQLCELCGDPTGRCGEDSITYNEKSLCEQCFDQVNELESVVLARVARELKDSDTPDVYILTDHAKELLTRELPFVSYKIPDFETLFGVPFESYPTIQQALQRVAELNQAGKSVALIAD